MATGSVVGTLDLQTGNKLPISVFDDVQSSRTTSLRLLHASQTSSDQVRIGLYIKTGVTLDSR